MKLYIGVFYWRSSRPKPGKRKPKARPTISLKMYFIVGASCEFCFVEIFKPFKENLTAFKMKIATSFLRLSCFKYLIQENSFIQKNNCSENTGKHPPKTYVADFTGFFILFYFLNFIKFSK